MKLRLTPLIFVQNTTVFWLLRNKSPGAISMRRRFTYDLQTLSFLHTRLILVFLAVISQFISSSHRENNRNTSASRPSNSFYTAHGEV